MGLVPTIKTRPHEEGHNVQDLQRFGETRRVEALQNRNSEFRVSDPTGGDGVRSRRIQVRRPRIDETGEGCS